MPKFRKKPVVIEAIQFVGGIDSAREIQDWAKKYELYIVWFVNYDSLSIDTLEGTMSAEPGDWVIRGVKDEFYPCKNDIFDATYELVEERKENIMNAIRENLAAYAHEAWSGWMKHMVSKSKVYEDGSVCIPVDLMERWNRQMNTSYEDLPANEQLSDLDEADRMIAIFMDNKR